MKIGIVAAMKEELEPFYSRLSGLKKDSRGKVNITTGYIGNIELVMVVCGIGKVNAAVVTTLLIKETNPDFLINCGVAGGFNAQVAIGDIVVSSKLRYYDADVTSFSFEKGQIPHMPAYFKSDTRLLELAEKSVEEIHTRVHFGEIISGDSFIHGEKQINELQTHFPMTLAVEMEGAAIAQTGYLFSVPFIVIRGISDLVRKTKNSSAYECNLKHAATAACDMVISMLSHLQNTQQIQPEIFPIFNSHQANV
ncbi:MAG: 5'-methylthioadenosine/adenosylhomocysteine nucleosidase [Desulfotalea sp.]